MIVFPTVRRLSPSSLSCPPSTFREVIFHLLKFFFGYFPFCVSLFQNSESRLFPFLFSRAFSNQLDDIDNTQNDQYPENNHKQPSESHAPSVISPVHHCRPPCETRL